MIGAVFLPLLEQVAEPIRSMVLLLFWLGAISLVLVLYSYIKMSKRITPSAEDCPILKKIYAYRFVYVIGLLLMAISMGYQ